MKKLKRKWKVYLIHHTHLDIGYTHTQDEVLKLQLGNLEKSFGLIEQSKGYAKESQFKWNPEILWAVEHWLDNADDVHIKKLSDIVKNGYIGLDGLYANFLTGLCRPEELDESFKIKRKIEKLLDVKIDSAMITDIPGWNWGLTSLLAENGIKYLSCGTNNSDRIGYIKEAWGDKPFYWVSPSGMEKTLVYIHGKGYSWFHTGRFGKNKDLSRKLNPNRISKYLYELEKQNYPYDAVLIRYNIGADNGPPDPKLSDIVKSWNEKYDNMQLVISTTSQAMRDFEQSYADKLPSFQGDITPYWEDGAASSSCETAVARQAGELYAQLCNLEASSADYSNEKLKDETLKDIMLYNEHTWGAYNSISKPDDEFAVSQWKWKSKHAYSALNGSVNLLEGVTRSKLLFPITIPDILKNNLQVCESKYITVYNTNSWSVSQNIEIQTSCNTVYDEKNNLIESQKLSNGNLAFRVNDIEANSSRIYRLDTIEVTQNENHYPNDAYIDNGIVKLKINENGHISSFIYNGIELVNKNRNISFNQLIYAKGKWGTRRILDKSVPEISVTDFGKVLTRIKIKRCPYRTNSLITYITVYNNDACIYITNIIDRPRERRKEGLYFSFPFAMRDGRVKYDVIYGSAELNKEQLNGSNKNFITATRWLDISDKSCGVSCALLDAPLVKFGKLVHDPIRKGNANLCGWLKKCTYNGLVHSYIMNNYWMTNYKADQEGVSVFRYVFMPHEMYDEHKTHKFAVEQTQKLIVVEGKTHASSPLIKTSDERLMVIYLEKNKNEQYIRVFNSSMQTVNAEITTAEKSKIEMVSPNKVIIDNVIAFAAKESVLLKYTNFKK